MEIFMVTIISPSSNTDNRSSVCEDKAGAQLIGSKDNPDNVGPGPQLLLAETLTGNDVLNFAQEKLGDIKGIMLDIECGKVAYAVLSVGGFLGLGDRLFAIP